MTDEINSTIIDAGGATEATLNDGLEPTPQEQGSTVKDDRVDAVTKAFDQVTKAADPVKEEKPEPVKAETEKQVKDVADPELKEAPAKPVKAAVEKPADGQETADRQASEARQYSAPPARFLPDAAEKWANVPNNVKAEFHRVSQEMETELETHREASKAYNEVREYSEMAKQYGTTLKQALDNYTGIEKLLKADPVQGIARVLQNIGITPQQYAQHVMRNPNAHVQQAPQPQQQAPQTSPEIEALRQELQAMRQEQQTASVLPVIEQFAANAPDYHMLQDKIANILKSGIIEANYGSGLTNQQKLAEAYRMAGGRPPSVSAEAAAVEHSEPQSARPVDLDGQKSINGSPNFGKEPKVTSRKKSSYEETIAAAMAQHGI